MEKFITGHCPLYDADKKIQIHYSEVRIIGDPILHYKKCNFYCKHGEDEQCKNYDGTCPLFMSAPIGF